MLKSLLYSRFRSFKPTGPRPTILAGTVRHYATLRPHLPRAIPRGPGLQILEDFDKQLKLKERTINRLAPISLEQFNRIKKSVVKRKFSTGELVLLFKMNQLVGVLNAINETGLVRCNVNDPTALEQVKKEIEQLIDELMSNTGANIGVLEWIIDNKLFTTLAFCVDQDRIVFIQALTRSCLKHSVFTNWDDFGSDFQDFAIQVWNDVSQQEAEAFCDGIISQVSSHQKENVYNAILECFDFHTLPSYSIKLGNRLLDEMVNLGLTPSALAYFSIFGFNLHDSAFRLKSNELKKIQEFKSMYKAMYTRHKARIADFGPDTWSLLLIFYSACATNSPDESVAVLELTNHLIDSEEPLSKQNYYVALKAAERLLDQFHPKCRNQGSLKKPITERIQLIAENVSHIKNFPSTSLFSILLVCYRKLVATNEEESISFISARFQSLVASGTPLETSHFESALIFYSKRGYHFDYETTLQMLEDNGLNPSNKILYAALNLNLTKNQAEKAFSLYNSVANDQNPNVRLLSRFVQTPEILSLMVVASVKLKKLQEMKKFIEICRETRCVLTSRCFLKCIENFLCFIKSGSNALVSTEYIESYKFLDSIKHAIKTQQPTCSAYTYTKLIEAHSKYCILYSEAKFNDFQHTLNMCLFEYKHGLTYFCYRDIYLAFNVFAKRDPALKYILLAETKKVVRTMLKYHVRVSCGIYYQLLTLVQMIGDDILFEAIFKKFQDALSKKYLIDTGFTSRILALAKQKKPVKCTNHIGVPTLVSEVNSASSSVSALVH